MKRCTSIAVHQNLRGGYSDDVGGVVVDTVQVWVDLDVLPIIGAAMRVSAPSAHRTSTPSVFTWVTIAAKAEAVAVAAS
jgi:hypothetical protein